MEEILLSVKNILKDEEEILSAHVSSNENTFYISIFKKIDLFLTIRISNHKKINSYYSNKSFNPLDNDLLQKIRIYLNDSSWYKFNYKDYFTIKLLGELKKRKKAIYIDNTMNIFYNSSTKLIFYMYAHSGRNKKDMYLLDDSFQSSLRKLYAEGIINNYKISDEEISIHVTKLGNRLVEKFEDKYQQQFENDISKIKFYKVEFPI